MSLCAFGPPLQDLWRETTKLIVGRTECTYFSTSRKYFPNQLPSTFYGELIGKIFSILILPTDSPEEPNFDLAAKTIADIYKNRWEVELFFKWLKQNLKIKTFLGTSRNAVLTQIWIALITMLVLSYMKFLAKLGQSITQIQRLLQLNLFKRQSLWELFDPPTVKHKTENGQKMLFNFS